MDKKEMHDILAVIVVAVGVAGMLLSVLLVSALSHYRLAIGVGSFAVVAGIICDWYSKRRRVK
jgi:hypothetical protein